MSHTFEKCDEDTQIIWIHTSEHKIYISPSVQILAEHRQAALPKVCGVDLRLNWHILMGRVKQALIQIRLHGRNEFIRIPMGKDLQISDLREKVSTPS